MKAMAADTILKSEQLRELVMLKGLMELSQSDATLSEACLAVIGAVRDKGRFPENRTVATDMISLLTYLKPGTPAPEFTLKDLRQQDVSLRALRGKPVLLTFWATYCQECLSGLDMIAPLFGRYRENIHFVSISSDRSFSKMAYFINQKRDYAWTFLHTGEHTEVLKDYDVRSYPLYVLIDSEGRIVKYATGGPGEGLEAEVERMLQK
jgi:peroxiredoxin